MAKITLKCTDKLVTKIYAVLLPAVLPYLTINIFEEQEKKQRKNI